MAEPVFGRDVAFYVYTLPLLELIVSFLLFVVAGLALTIALYVLPFVVTTG